MTSRGIVVAKRGTYCDAAVPDKTYFGAHGCTRKDGIRRHKGGYFCKLHRTRGHYK